MHLPPGFPHTRHEQYLVALPNELLTPAELLNVVALLDRSGLYLQAIKERSLAELAARGHSEADIERLLHPRLPRALYPSEDVFLGEDDVYP